MSKTRSCEAQSQPEPQSQSQPEPQAETENNRKDAVEDQAEAEWAIWHKNQANRLVKEAAARKEASELLAARKECTANCIAYSRERAIRDKEKLDDRRALRQKAPAGPADKRIALSDVASA